MCRPQASQINMPDVARRIAIVVHTILKVGAGGHQVGNLRSDIEFLFAVLHRIELIRNVIG
jgi:hypothetical protein